MPPPLAGTHNTSPLGRANRIFVYRVSSGRLVQALADPDLLEAGLPIRLGVSHRDLVQSLAFSPRITFWPREGTARSSCGGVRMGCARWICGERETPCRVWP